MTTTAPRFYSYLRFSTPEQSTGDSIRRQTALAQKWARENGVALDDNLRMEDHGLSSFHQKNIGENGALGQFLGAIKNGQVPRGSALLVESLDRLSRAAVKDALRQFMNILESGVDIVTLGDGQRYSWANLDEKQLIISIFIASRAHEESAEKSRRIGSMWAEKHRQAREAKRPATGKIPLWLKLDKATGAIHVIEDRAAIVRRIFQESLAGDGVGVIAGRLNKEGVPTWGKSPEWNASYITLILTGGAAAGRYVPTTLKDGKRVKLDAIDDYYPSVVSMETYHETIHNMESRNLGAGRPGKISNLFTHLCQCGYCGRPATHVYRSGQEKRDKGRERLICSEARKSGGKCDCYTSFDYLDFEDAFLRYCREVDLSALVEQDARAGEIVQAQREVDTLNGALLVLQSKIDGLMATMPYIKVATIAEQLANDLNTTGAELEDLTQKRDSASMRLDALRRTGQTVVDHVKSIRELQTLMNDGDEGKRIAIRQKLKHAIARAVECITVFPAGLQGRAIELVSGTLEVVDRKPGLTPEQEVHLAALLTDSDDHSRARGRIIRGQRRWFKAYKASTTGKDKAVFLVRFSNGHCRAFQWNIDDKTFEQVRELTATEYTTPLLKVAYTDDGDFTLS